MKKILFGLFLLTNILFGDILDDTIKNIIGTKKYNLNQKLIKLLFKNRTNFVYQQQINYLRLFKVLKQNGLLDLALKKPSVIKVEFVSKQSNIKTYKILYDTMQTLGYQYFFTDKLTLKKDYFDWKILLKAEYILDPIMLLQELHYHHGIVTKIIVQNKTDFVYHIDLQNSSLNNTIEIQNNEKYRLKKPLKPYMLNLNQNATKLTITSRKLNNWYPNIVFFDTNLNILKNIQKVNIYKKLVVAIPPKTKYIKITDTYNLINIKRGLTILVQ